jgi:hypothetical protein
MTAHELDNLVEHDGGPDVGVWEYAVCSCGWESELVDNLEAAAEMHAEHATMEAAG